MDSDFYKVLFGIIKIIILILGTIGIIGYVFVKNHGEKVVKSWAINRQHPTFMPFAGILGKNSSNNSISVFKHYFGNNFTTLISPIHYILNLYHTIFNKLFHDLDIFRVYLIPIRLFFFNMAKLFYQQLDNMLAISAYLFVKIRDMLKRLASTFRLTLYTFNIILLSIQSIWDGPIGKTSRALGYLFSPLQGYLNSIANYEFCLHPDTKIKLLNNFSKKIKHLEIDDYLEKDNQIIGMIYVIYNKNYMYKVKDNLFTENHLIYSELDLKWKTASELGVKTITNNNYICCPLTTTHQLYTDDNLFITDYEECINNNLEKDYLTRLCNKLNMDTNTINLNIIKSYSGFSKNSIIKINNKQTEIYKLSLDKIINGQINNELNGICKQKNNTYWIQINKNLMVTPRQLIYYQNNWYFADNLPLIYKRVPINKDNNIQYSIITNTHYIETDNYRFMDYTEMINDNQHSKQILNYLNTVVPNIT